MKTLKDLLAIGTILPTLLVTGAGVAAASAGERTFDGASDGTIRVAQATKPEEDPLKRPPAPGAAPRPAAPPAQAAPPRPPAAPHVAPPAPHVAPPAPARPPAAPPVMRDPPPAARPAAPIQREAPRPAAPPPPVEHRTPPPAPTHVAPPPPVHVAPPTPPAPTAPVAPKVERPAAPVAPSLAPSGQAPMVRPAAPPAAAPAPVPPPAVAPAPSAPAPGVPAAGGGHPLPPQGGAPGAGPGHPPGPGAGHPPGPGPGPGVAPVPPQAQPVPPQPGVAPVPPQPGAQFQPGRPGEPGRPPHAEGPQPRPGGPGVGGVLGAAAVGAAVGVIGGALMSGGGRAEGLDDVRRQRREIDRDGAKIYAEPDGRVIVRDGDGLFLRHDETARFRDFGGESTVERRGDETVSIWRRPDGVRIVTVTDADGRLIRRVREWPDGRREVLIDDGFRPRGPGFRADVVVLPPPPVPRERWVIESDRADERMIEETLEAPPLGPLPRRYTLDEVRTSRDLRAYMPAIDVDTITFPTGAWSVEPEEIGRLARIARGITRALARNPDEIFLVEGHTDLVGNDVDNLSLSDRRAQAVAAVLTRDFAIPAENLVTQGYGAQFPKEMTDGPSQINRRVTVRRITPLIGADAGR